MLVVVGYLDLEDVVVVGQEGLRRDQVLSVLEIVRIDYASRVTRDQKLGIGGYGEGPDAHFCLAGQL